MQFSWETILMFCFPGAKIWSRFVNVCSVGLAPKDNVRHDKFRFFDLLQIAANWSHSRIVFKSIFPQGKEYGRTDHKYWGEQSVPWKL